MVKQESLADAKVNVLRVRRPLALAKKYTAI